jgi:hypothetical protein
MGELKELFKRTMHTNRRERRKIFDMVWDIDPHVFCNPADAIHLVYELYIEEVENSGNPDALREYEQYYEEMKEKQRRTVIPFPTKPSLHSLKR